ncbi:hypothetical protein [Actinoalloteichus hymeniacidonis]|uniref:Ribulose 1,5-bisphosphate carboxylase large subunit n=1 Tax=Actinoalloteichus hymeniacidonis TaxID=340345 RepID=A0AAC9HSV1_9PSEU|nr:hypothetical protein [Actinoalloteichus hymeniacidonis]AOS64808.1 hypothetical protein TL08_20085 [Actinoalloteichus hymeniacidonis]MBB5907118.1 hypothetical protein [Actinoalloteichus hymeniacidonis]
MALWGVAPIAVAERIGTSIGRATGYAVESVTALISLPLRVVVLLETIEMLVSRVSLVLDATEVLLARARLVVDEAESTLDRTADIVTVAAGTVDDAGRITDTASGVVARAEDATSRARALLAEYEPLARRLAPMATQFVDHLSPKEVEAANRLVDKLPILTEHLLDDILPILGTLDRVGPDIHQLLSVADEVRKAVLGIPGFGFFRRRGGDERHRGESNPESDSNDTEIEQSGSQRDG